MSDTAPAGDLPDAPEPDESSPAAFPTTSDDTPSFPPTADAGATRALAAFLKLYPFLDLHDRAGANADHRVRGWVCFSLDLCLRLVVVVLIVAVILAIAWKTLAPFPPGR